MSATSTRPRIASLRSTVRSVVTVLSALAVVAITGAVLAAGLAVPAPQAQPVDATRVDIGAGSLELICPDAPVLSTDAAGVDIDYDAEFGTDVDQVTTSTQAVVLEADGAQPEQVGVGALGQDRDALDPGEDATVHTGSEATTAAVLTAEPAQDLTPLGAASAAARTDSGDLRGLSLAACLPPSTTQWLVGGSSDPGSSARLLLTNAGETPVTATAHVWGETGPVEEPAEVLVPPAESRSVLLETVSQEERLAVRVSAEGGHLGVAIQDSLLHGVVPAGTDMITAATDPATVVNLGPVQVTEDEAENNPPVLRLVNPASEEATVSVDLLTSSGPQVLAGAQDQVLEPGTVTDISLDGTEPGPLAVQVHSDVAVTGSVLRTVVGQAGDLDPNEPVRDRAWLAAQPTPERGVLGVPIELVEEVSLLLANPLPQTQDVQVRPIDDTGTAGEPVTVEVPSGAATVLDDEQLPTEVEASGEPVVAVEISGQAVLAALMAGGQADDGPLLSMLALTPDAAAAQQVDVRVGSF